MHLERESQAKRKLYGNTQNLSTTKIDQCFIPWKLPPCLLLYNSVISFHSVEDTYTIRVTGSAIRFNYSFGKQHFKIRL